MFRLLEEGENYQKGDEYFDGMGVWHEVPEDWLKLKFSHKQDNTMSRMKLPVRRKIQDESQKMRNNIQMFQLLCEKFIKVYESTGISYELAVFADEVYEALAQQKH